ncbi:hypothetical protein AGMMS49944_22360 [Spirochaetia bacterium]|nr:hypothetical protein AGMMS49944_22360 [Spirochaetia bacterium]
MGFGNMFGSTLGYHAANAIAGKGNAAKANAKAYANAQIAVAEQAAEAAAEAADNEEKKEGIQTIMAITFEGDAPSIIARLGELQTLIGAHKDGDKSAAKAIRAAALEKMELGIRLLSGKGDTANAAYFEGKLKKLKTQVFWINNGTGIFLGIFFAVAAVLGVLWYSSL